MDIKIHINPAQPHQKQHGSWFKSGFRKHGLNATITADPLQEAEIHVVSGPWYAKEQWKGHPRVLLLDRCYYRGDPGHVSLGWMNADGGRDFKIGKGRIAPIPKENAGNGTSIFLADYNGPIEKADEIRLHPAQKEWKKRDSLEYVLSRHSKAIGYQTTALVTAGLMGLEIICKDERNIMFQPNWLELLPYADWHHSEIENGEAWEHLNAFK